MNRTAAVLLTVGALALSACTAAPAEAATDRTVYVVGAALPAAYQRPLELAVLNWNRQGRVSLVLDSTCRTGEACADFALGDLAARGSAGLTNYVTLRPGCAAWTPACGALWHVEMAQTIADQWAEAGPDLASQRMFRRVVRSTLCHEIGHVLGVGHDAGGCMTPDRDPSVKFLAGARAIAQVADGSLDDVPVT